MRKLSFIFIFPVIVALATGCNDDNNWEDYADWRNANNAWMEQESKRANADGSPYYTTIRPDYDKGQYVLVHWFNDRAATAGNLSPYYTSTVDVKYIGRNYQDEAFDSSYLLTAYGDSIFRTTLSGVISGWGIALQQMHVGDSVQVIVPYQSGYGTTGYGNILPYSNLQFNIKLVDIPYWETKQ